MLAARLVRGLPRVRASTRSIAVAASLRARDSKGSRKRETAGKADGAAPVFTDDEASDGSRATDPIAALHATAADGADAADDWSGTGSAARAAAGDSFGRRDRVTFEEELQRLSSKEREVWHRRMQSFIDAVYDQKEAKVEAVEDDGPAGDEDVEDLKSLDRILASSDPIRTKFLESTAENASAGFVDYCIFCFHGTHIAREDNSLLLSQFVSVDGRILPRRLTHLCAKHQRKLRRTIKRSQHMNLLPHQHKLHPRLRFSSFHPDPALENWSARAKAQKDGGAYSVLSAAQTEHLDAALNELRAFAPSTTTAAAAATTTPSASAADATSTSR